MTTIGRTVLAAAMLTPLVAASDALANHTCPPSALDALGAVAGHYEGSWESFGLDSDRNVVRTSSWTDAVEAKNPALADGRAFVDVQDVMTFDNGQSYTATWKEGFFVLADGSAGNRYFESYGRTTIENQLGPDLWSFESVADARDLTMMGFDPATVLAAKHVMVKSTTRIGGIDTEWVTRVSTVQWKQGDDVRTIQFVSLKGHHTRS